MALPMPEDVLWPEDVGDGAPLTPPDMGAGGPRRAGANLNSCVKNFFIGEDEEGEEDAW